MNELPQETTGTSAAMTHQVLDCTLRDGGYYNNWDFPPHLVQRYLDSMAQTGVQIVEVGFRSRHQDRYMGACYYTTDDFLRSLSIPSELEVAVMVNAADLFASEHPWGLVQAVNELFVHAESSPVDWVRIAAHPAEAEALGPAISRLHALGYKVGLNIMQISRLTSEEIQSTVTKIASGPAPDILYFADSLGNMNPARVRQIIKDIRTEWDETLGIHTHDNMGLALANSIEAIDCGATWVDGTVHGMGRGAGNASTESLLLQLAQAEPERFFPTSIFGLIRTDFEPLYETYSWGSNIYYAYAASHSIHPTYVQQMLSTDSYQLDDVMAALETLAREEGRSRYCSESLRSAVQSHYTDSSGSWSPSSWVAGRPVLLVANGPSAKSHQVALTRLIEQWQPVVICMNYVPWIDPKLVDAYAFCHPTRLASFIEQMPSLEAPIITPLDGLSDTMRERLQNHQVFDYGLCIDPGEVGIFDMGCRLPQPFVAGYALSLAFSGGTSQAILAGFDGYGGDISRIANMNRCLTQLRAAADMVITSVTPCPYQVDHDSLYSPRWSQPPANAPRKSHEAFDHHPRKISV